MATRYRLPEALGGGEYEEYRHVDGGTEAPVGTVAFLLDGAIFAVARNLLTEVKPPLPEEPPFGALVATGTLANPLPIWRRWMDTGWDEVGARGGPSRTWAEVCADSMQRAGRPPVRLVLDPFDEPVELPWVFRGDVHSTQVRVTGGVVLDQVLHDASGTGKGVQLNPDVARTKAKALWAAADQAERAS